MPVWATAGSGRLAACFLDSMATMQLPAMGYGLRYEYGMFQQAIQDGWQIEQPGQLAAPARPWEVAASARDGRGQAELLVRGAGRAACARSPAGRPACIGIPYDRPVVGYGGKTINTLRLWAAAAPDYFDFQEFSSGDFVGAVAETLAAEIADPRAVSRRLDARMGQGLRFVQEYFLVACSLADLVRRFRRSNNDWNTLARQGRHPAQRHASRRMAVAELMRILLDEAQLGWDQAWDLTAADAGLHQPHAAARSAGEMAGRLVRDAAAAAAGNHLRDQPPVPRRRPRPLSRRRGPRRAHEPDRGRRRAASPHGQPGHRRLAQHQRRGRDPLRAAAHDDGQGPRRDVSRSASTTRPTASRRGAGCCWPTRRWPSSSPRPSATAGSPTSTSLRKLEAAGRRHRLSRRRSARPSAQAKSQLRRLAQGDHRPGGRPRHASSTARSSASTNTSGNCSTRCTSSCSTTGCARTRSWTCRRARSSSPARRRRPTSWPS